MAIARIMCFGNTNNKDDPDAKKSREIEKQLREDQRRMQKEVKLLLLGRRRTGSTRYCDAELTHTQGRESRASRRC